MSGNLRERSEAFDSLVREFGDPVLRYLRRRAAPDVVDDVFNDTMLAAWRRFEDIPSDVLPWLYVTARNCLRNAERSQRRQQRLIDRIQTVDPPVQAYDAADLDGPAAAATDAMAALKPVDAEVLRLWAWEELTLPEIGRALQITTNAATIRLHRAKKKLRTEIERQTALVGHEQLKEGGRSDVSPQ